MWTFSFSGLDMYKGRLDNCSPTGPNEAVRVGTLLLWCLYDGDKKKR